jgi:hypothetical protein
MQELVHVDSYHRPLFELLIRALDQANRADFGEPAALAGSRYATMQPLSFFPRCAAARTFPGPSCRPERQGTRPHIAPLTFRSAATIAYRDPPICFATV